jgi:hypothetical protein
VDQRMKSSDGDADLRSLTEQLLAGLQQAAQALAPEFVRTMPSAYFDEIPQPMRLAHPKAILAAEASGLSQTVMLLSLLIHQESGPLAPEGPLWQQLAQDLKRLPHLDDTVLELAEKVTDAFHLAAPIQHVTRRPCSRQSRMTVTIRMSVPYDEAYGLAFAQHHKNKDIPEGGSKAVILAAPGAELERVGRAFADGLLDLVIPNPQLALLHADHYGRDELLYLGPDENISNPLITWAVERARLRGQPMPAAFWTGTTATGRVSRVSPTVAAARRTRRGWTGMS